MRKLFGWMAGLVGIAALARILAARRTGVAAPVPTTVAPEADPAEALRRKLSETREEPRAATGTPSTTGAPEPTETLEERRARVHAKAQEAMDAMEALQEPPT